MVWVNMGSKRRLGVSHIPMVILFSPEVYPEINHFIAQTRSMHPKYS